MPRQQIGVRRVQRGAALRRKSVNGRRNSYSTDKSEGAMLNGNPALP